MAAECTASTRPAPSVSHGEDLLVVLTQVPAFRRVDVGDHRLAGADEPAQSPVGEVLGQRPGFAVLREEVVDRVLEPGGHRMAAPPAPYSLGRDLARLVSPSSGQPLTLVFSPMAV